MSEPVLGGQREDAALAQAKKTSVWKSWHLRNVKASREVFEEGVEAGWRAHAGFVASTPTDAALAAVSSSGEQGERRVRDQLDLALGEARTLEGDEKVWPDAPLSRRLNDLLRFVKGVQP